MTYAIATPAEWILEVTLDVHGTIAATRRRRVPSARATEITASWSSPRPFRRPLAFTASVEPDHSGVVAVTPKPVQGRTAPTLIPLGPQSPFLESELPIDAGSDGAFSIGTIVSFEFDGVALAWSALNIAGRIELSARVPEVSIQLRLPADQHGSLVFDPATLPPAGERPDLDLSFP